MIFQSFTASLVFSNWENHQTWQEFGKSEEIFQYNNKLPKPGKKQVSGTPPTSLIQIYIWVN